MKKPIIIFICVFAILLIVAGGFTWQWSRNILVIQNESGQTIDVVTVTVCGKTYQLEGLEDGSSGRVDFDVTTDSGFQVDVTFDDGSKTSGEFGYVTGGAGRYNNRAAVTIKEDGIEGTQEN